MVTFAGRHDEQVPRSIDERGEQPSLEGLRLVLRIVIALSLAATVILAVIPVFGTLGLLSILVAALAYGGLMLVTRVEHRRWLARHGDRPDASREVGFRVVTGGESGGAVDRGDATADQELRRSTVAPVETPRDEVGSKEMFSAPQRAGVKVLLRIAVIVGVLAVAVAAMVFDWQYLGVGLLLALAFMMLFGFPVWLASIEDAAEAKKQGGTAAVRPRRP